MLGLYPYIAKCEVAEATFATQGRQPAICFMQLCLTIFFPYLETECGNNCSAFLANINCSTPEHFNRCLPACLRYDPLDETSSCYHFCVSYT